MKIRLRFETNRQQTEILVLMIYTGCLFIRNLKSEIELLVNPRYFLNSDQSENSI